MGRTQKGRVADLSKALLRGTASLRDSLWLLNEAAAAEVVKEDWGEVKKVADKVAKEATTIGMLWTQGLKDEDANQALKTYFEGLQALLLLCHACTVGAGPALLVTIRNAAQQVVNASLTLLTRALSFSIKGAEKQEREAILPAHVGSVWEACNTLKGRRIQTEPPSVGALLKWPLLSRMSCKRSGRLWKDRALSAMLVTVAMLMTKEEEGMKLTATMQPTATAMMTLDTTFVVMMTLDIYILQMILAMVIVNSATLILATSIAIITCHIHS
ncbi:unnamed protein product [Sphagnum balticum]